MKNENKKRFNRNGILAKAFKYIFVMSICLFLLTSCDLNKAKDITNEQRKNAYEKKLNNEEIPDLLTDNPDDYPDNNQDDNPDNDQDTEVSEDNTTDTPTPIETINITEENPNSDANETFLIPEGKTIRERFNVPKGFSRVPSEEGTFANYLQNLPLKPEGSKVKYYDGREKMRDVYLAVVDFSLGNRDLQQCADAVIRLRAEYLYTMKRYDEIHFNFVSGFNAKFTKWAEGNTIAVNGNQVTWKTNSNNNRSYESFQKYLDMVYAYASTLSLEKELSAKSFTDLEIGDVFIQGGSPGHCVIVVDMAVNETSGEKIFMLAQSYMPAQDIQILKGNSDASPWFSIKNEDILLTPEWTFHLTDLKTW